MQIYDLNTYVPSPDEIVNMSCQAVYFIQTCRTKAPGLGLPTSTPGQTDVIFYISGDLRVLEPTDTDG